jgi:rhodanese-related sulfurtransferase
MTLRRLLLFALVALVAAVALVLLAPLAVAERVVAWRFPRVPEVTTAALAARLAAGEEILLLDARERAEFEVSHLPGARWIGPAVTDLEGPGALPTDRPVVLYCSVGWRSALAVERLQARGAGRVENLRGSIFRWAKEGRPLVDGAGRPTRTVHPFSPVWGWMLALP